MDQSESSVSNDSTEESSVSVVISKKAVKKRMNKKRYTVNLFPRIIKRDLRRLYPRMLSNVMNAGDPCLLAAFFATFARPDCSFNQQCPNRKSPEVESFRNLDTLLLQFAVQCDLMPDMTIQLQNSSIHLFRHTPDHKNTPKFSSEIQCEMVFSGTVLYAYDRTSTSDMALEMENCLLSDACPRISQMATSEELMANMEEHQLVPSSFVAANVPDAIAKWKKLVHPKESKSLVIKGGLRLTVDEENRISGVFCLG